MMKKLKKFIALLTAMVITVSALTACGGTQGEADVTQNAAVSSKEEPVKLSFWAMSDDEDCYNAVIEAYQKDHPNVEIEMVLYSSPEIDKALVTALAGKEEIDLFVCNGGQYLSGKIDTGMAENLDKYIENSGLDTSIFGEDFDSVIYDDGSIYGLPYRNSVSLLVYNKDLFDERGVAYPTVDTTWDELTEIAQKMTWGEGADKVYGFYNAQRNTDWLGPATQNGINYRSDDLSLIQKAMELKIDACDKGVMLSNAAYTAAGIGVRNMFTSRKSAMYIGGDWTIRQLRGDKEAGTFTDNWDVAPMPTLGEGYAKNTSMGQFVYASVCSYSKNKEVAYDFLQYLCGEPGGMIFAEKGTLPAIRTQEAKEVFCGDRTQLPANIDVFFDTKTVEGMPVKKGIFEMDTFLKPEVDMVFSGEKTAEEVVAALYEEQKKYTQQ